MDVDGTLPAYTVSFPEVLIRLSLREFHDAVLTSGIIKLGMKLGENREW
jgi:hypothetical protein